MPGNVPGGYMNKFPPVLFVAQMPFMAGVYYGRVNKLTNNRYAPGTPAGNWRKKASEV